MPANNSKYRVLLNKYRQKLKSVCGRCGDNYANANFGGMGERTLQKSPSLPGDITTLC